MQFIFYVKCSRATGSCTAWEISVQDKKKYITFILKIVWYTQTNKSITIEHSPDRVVALSGICLD